jgi:hypothetical protein
MEVFFGIVNVKDYLDEFPSLNFHLSALRGHSFEEILG